MVKHGKQNDESLRRPDDAHLHSLARERADQVLPESLVIGEVLDGTDDVLWRPLDGLNKGPYLLDGRGEYPFVSPGEVVTGKVVSEELTYECRDADGNQVGAMDNSFWFVRFGFEASGLESGENPPVLGGSRPDPDLG